MITQISDGQPQAPTSAPGPVVTQITDGMYQTKVHLALNLGLINHSGQPQAPAPTGNVTTNTTSPAIPEFPGTASTHAAGIGALVAAMIAMVAML